MISVIIEYQMYSIGICSIAILVGFVYFAKNLIHRGKQIKELHKTRTSIRERINKGEIMYEKNKTHTYIDEIAHTIELMEKEIGTSQTKKVPEDIHSSEENVVTREENTTEEETRNQTRTFYPQTSQEDDILHTEQIRIMNKNISKFLLVYREKDAIIANKTKAISILQQIIGEKNICIDTIGYKLKTIEQNILKMIEEMPKNKDKTLNEKLREIDTQIQKANKKNQVASILFIICIVMIVG